MHAVEVADGQRAQRSPGRGGGRLENRIAGLCPSPRRLVAKPPFCPLPGRQIGGQHQRAEAAAVQRLDPIANGRHHALDLVVLAPR